MSIGNHSAFPTSVDFADGMTYRMWLVGQVAVGYIDQAEMDYSIDPKIIIRYADAIIAQLDVEEQSRAEAQIELAKDRRTEPTR